MYKVIYDLTVQYPNQPAGVVSHLEEVGEGITEASLATMYLDRLEATLEKIETGKRGLLRVGGRIFPVSDEGIPQLSVRINSMLVVNSSDPLHIPDGAPVFTETELATAPAVSRSVVAVVERKK